MAPSLTDIEDARGAVLARARALPPEQVAIDDALGMIAAESVTSADAVPGFDNSAMDGYAVRAPDTGEASERSPAVLEVVDESRAGRPAQRSLASGEAIAISTGAMVPAGADAVVRVEDTSAADGRVEVRVPAAPGANVRRAGEDIMPGQVVIEAGADLGAAELGVLAAVGRSSITCSRRPTIHLLTTGDELQKPGEELRPGGIRNSNAHSLAALVKGAGGVLAATEIVRDDPASTREALERALAADITIVSGGVSVGAHDHVRPALADLGVEQVFWGVALRPGKPTWFGARGSALAYGLPGNPVSAIVTFILFVRPAIRAMLGARGSAPRAQAILEVDYEKRPGRAHLLRCRVELGDDGWHAIPAEAQGSHVLTSMVGADALAVIPTGAEVVRAGERVEIELLPR